MDSAPTGPAVGVAAVIIHRGQAVLIRRGKDPLRGRWVVPGGTVELGESLAEAVVREVWEETGLTVVPRELLAVFEHVDREGGRVRYHYVIADFLCDYVSGTAAAASDADALALVGPSELSAYDLPEKALEVVRDGFRRCGLAGAG